MTLCHSEHRRARRIVAAAALALAATAVAALFTGCTQAVGPTTPSAATFAAASVDTAGDRGTIPFSMRAGVPVVTVRYAEPRVTAVLATGDPAGRFPAAAGPLLGMTPTPTDGPVYLLSPDGTMARQAGLMHADAVTVSGVTFHDLTVAAADDDAPEVFTAADPAAPWPAHGRLGGQMFRACLLTVDYPNALIWVDHGHLPPVDGDEVLPLVTSRHGFPLVDVHVGSTHYWAKLDTGCPDALRVPAGLARQFAGPVRLTAGRNTLACTKPVVAPDGLLTIGSGALADFAVTFDMAHGRVRLHRRIDAEPATAAVPTAGRAHG